MHTIFPYLISVFSVFGILSKSPAGTLPLAGMNNVYLDKAEVTNALWREYMRHIKEHPEKFDSNAYVESYPNLELWSVVYPTDFDRPNKFDQYPVVAVNYPQVVNFCKWRSKNISTKRGQNIVYTLPTVFEFTRAAKYAKPLLAGLYNTQIEIGDFIGLCDNAKEMTNLEGIAMAGYGAPCMDTVFFFKAENKLGFRCKAYFK